MSEPEKAQNPLVGDVSKVRNVVFLGSMAASLVTFGALTLGGLSGSDPFFVGYSQAVVVGKTGLACSFFLGAKAMLTGRHIRKKIAEGWYPKKKIKALSRSAFSSLASYVVSFAFLSSLSHGASQWSGVADSLVIGGLCGFTYSLGSAISNLKAADPSRPQARGEDALMLEPKVK